VPPVSVVVQQAMVVFLPFGSGTHPTEQYTLLSSNNQKYLSEKAVQQTTNSFRSEGSNPV
jgi:ribosomal protein L11 methylase PrmA